MNKPFFMGAALMTALATHAAGWVYQGDDFVIENGRLAEFQARPGIQRGLIETEDVIHADILKTSLLRDGDATWFLSDDEIVLLKGDGRQELLLPGMKERMQAKYQATPDVRILADTADLRAVAENRQYILAADFRKPGSVGYLAAETPALVSTQHRLADLDISVSPVSSEQRVITLVIHPITEPFMDSDKLNRFTAAGISELLASEPELTDPEKRVTLQKIDNQLFIHVQAANLSGRSYTFRLKRSAKPL
ncbi:MAG: hypothetical protein JEZ10_06270 [Verrucomicrobia bacterium]|nr:hypothetical protein [Verrucomicrobiota bacterium]